MFKSKCSVLSAISAISVCACFGASAALANEKEVSEQCFKEATECMSKSTSNESSVIIRMTNTTTRASVTQQCLSKCDPKAIFAAPVGSTAGTTAATAAAAPAAAGAGTAAAAGAAGALGAGTLAAAVAAVTAVVATTTETTGTSGTSGTTGTTGTK